MNGALLGKVVVLTWGGYLQLRQIILAKYKLERNRWDISNSSYHHSALWKGIISVKDSFASDIKFKVG